MNINLGDWQNFYFYSKRDIYLFIYIHIYSGISAINLGNLKIIIVNTIYLPKSNIPTSKF